MRALTDIRAAVANVSEQSIEFFRDLIRTKSFSGQEQAVVERIRQEMERLGYDEILVDDFGNILGRIGRGKHHIAIDSHIDTVEVGDPSLWNVDPFAAEMRDGVIYGRGASDQKGGICIIDPSLDPLCQPFIVKKIKWSSCFGPHNKIGLKLLC